MPLGYLATSPPQRSTTPPRRLSTLTTAPSRLCSLQSSTPRHPPLPPHRSPIQQLPTHAYLALPPRNSTRNKWTLLRQLGLKTGLLSLSTQLSLGQLCICHVQQRQQGRKEGLFEELVEGAERGKGRGMVDLVAKSLW